MAVVGVLAFWAGRQVVSPPSTDPGQSASTPTYTADSGTLGEVLTYTGTLSWHEAATAVSPADGVLTSSELPEDGQVEAGDPVYRVDEVAVIACQGAVPAYRDLAPGNRGRDVAQLRVCLGLEEGDLFDPALEQALRDHPVASLGSAEDIVPLGSVVFVPELPARAQLAEGLLPGSRLSAGQSVLNTYAAAPKLVLTVSSTAPVVPSEGMRVTGEVAGRPVHGVLGPGSTNSTGERVMEVLAPDGGAACRSACAQSAPLPGPVDVPMQVEIVPPADGTLVPVAAIQTLPDGSTQVVATDGTAVAVSVLVSVGGQAVVDGLAAGTEILLFGPPPAP